MSTDSCVEKVYGEYTSWDTDFVFIIRMIKRKKEMVQHGFEYIIPACCICRLQ